MYSVWGCMVEALAWTVCVWGGEVLHGAQSGVEAWGSGSGIVGALAGAVGGKAFVFCFYLDFFHHQCWYSTPTTSLPLPS